MTALLGGSVVLIAAAAVALILGWSESEESLVWGAVAGCAGALVLLTVAWLRTRVVPAGAPPEESETPTTATVQPAVSPAEAASAGAAPKKPAAATGSKTRAGRPEPAAKKTAADRAAAATTPAAKKTAADRAAAATPATPRSPRQTAATAPAAKPVERKTKQAEVVAVPDRKKFHRPDCRFAKAKGAERMSKATARRRAYTACGVCKP